MKPTLDQIIRPVAIELGFISSWSDTIPEPRKTQLINYVNDVKQDAVIACKPASLLKDFRLPLVGTYSTGTIAINQNALQATLTTGVLTTAMNGRKIKIGDYNLYTISGVNTSTNKFNIDVPYIGSSVTASAFTMYQDIYSVPTELIKIIFLRDINNRRSPAQVDPRSLIAMFPDPTEYTGDILMYADMGSVETDEVVGTMSAATSTTLTCATLGHTYDNYYKGWYAYNSTIGKTVRIASSVLSTGVITYEEALTGQQSTDSITLKQPNRQVMIRYTPDSTNVLYGTGIMPPTRLLNDNDLENELPEDFAANILQSGCLYKWKMNNDRDLGSNFIAIQRDYNKMMNGLNREVQWLPNRTYQFGQFEYANSEVNPMKGGSFPFYEW